MGFDKIKCYICQAEFPDKSSVIKHIKRKHSDHLETRAYATFVGLNEVESSRVKTQIDVVKVAVNQAALNNKPNVDAVERKTKEISEQAAIDRANEADERTVMSNEAKDAVEDKVLVAAKEEILQSEGDDAEDNNN